MWVVGFREGVLWDNICTIGNFALGFCVELSIDYLVGILVLGFDLVNLS